MNRTDTDLPDAIERIEPEMWCSDNGVDFRLATGSSGTQLQIRECPRCGGTSWKVFLNAETGLGNCFHGACVGEPGFNLFSFAKAWLNLTPSETAKHITAYAAKMGWRPKNGSRYKKPVVPDNIRLPECVKINTTNNPEYLEDRGIDGATAEKFDLRFSENGTYDYVNYEGKPARQNYGGRILIPVRDTTGKIVTFQGRDTTGTADKKYLFPPGLPGTGKYLYNADKAMGKVDLVMGEGAFDVIAIDLAFKGFDEVGAIGSFGKSFSASETASDDQLHQLAILKRHGAKSLTFMWDSEPKTIADACDAVDKIKRVMSDVRIAILPPGCDPNEVSALEVRAAKARALPATRANILKLRFTHR